MICKLNGIEFDITREHLIGDVNYPRGWFQDASNRAAMGITDEADPVPPAPTQEEILAQAKVNFINIVQTHLDSAAQARGYDSVISACSYAGASNPFQAEGAAFVAWRGNVWATCYTIMGEVVAGTRAIPTETELLALLPALA